MCVHLRSSADEPPYYSNTLPFFCLLLTPHWSERASRVAQFSYVRRVNSVRISILLLALCFGNIAAAEPRKAPAHYFAFYPVVPADSPARVLDRFEYEIPFSGGKIAQGAYSPEPILTLEHLQKVDTEIREIGTVPICVLRFSLNKSGIRQLQHFLRQPAASELVAFIDGRAYSTIPIKFVRDIPEQRRFFLVLPSPQASTACHFVELLAEKLQAKIATKSWK